MATVTEACLSETSSPSPGAAVAAAVTTLGAGISNEDAVTDELGVAEETLTVLSSPPPASKASWVTVTGATGLLGAGAGLASCSSAALRACTCLSVWGASAGIGARGEGGKEIAAASLVVSAKVIGRTEAGAAVSGPNTGVLSVSAAAVGIDARGEGGRVIPVRDALGWKT
jgi:hypothetical protein